MSNSLNTTTKVFASGNSDAVRLSKKLKEAMGLKTGDEVTLAFDPATHEIRLKKQTTESPVSPEFMKRFDKLYDQNAGLMNRLKDL